MAHHSLRNLQKPTSRARSSYTWRRRKGPSTFGVVLLGMVMVLAVYIGPARPMSSPALAAAWAEASQRSGLGATLRSLPQLADNRVTNHEFIPGDSPAQIPGWQHSFNRPGSSVRAIYIHNTPQEWYHLEIVPRDGDTALVQQWIGAEDNPALTLAFTAHALSTMGDARVYAELVDKAGRHIGTVGWTLVGAVPASGAAARWFDHRTRANYQGGELSVVVDLASVMKGSFGADPSRLGKVGLFFYASDGQHLLIESVYVGPYTADSLQKDLASWAATDEAPDSPWFYVPPVAHDPVVVPVIRGLSLAITPHATRAVVGETFNATARMTNTSDVPIGPLTATFDDPYGFGVVAQGPITIDIGILEPGQHHDVTWSVRAMRPHSVNLGKPWSLGTTVSLASGEVLKATSTIEVVDKRPGRLFYVLTDDLEPMDSAGYPTRFTGNRNAWLDPEEFRVQLIEKSEAMNRIADRYGAKWSHYIAWPVVVGAEWAATQSTTGEWERVTTDLIQSVANGAANGHQYTPHLHMDYDYRLTHTFLSYHEPTDGYWANHREHGWAHQILRLGEFDEINSRTGTLFDYLRRIDEIIRDSGQGQQLATRIGSFDFGAAASDQRKSVEAFRRVGLWASSDAHGNVGGTTAAPYGESMYFSRPDSINARADRLEEIGIVQFLPTPARAIIYEGESVASANDKVDQAILHYASRDGLRPGVNSVVAFTHAMFLLGDGGWQSTTGGAFSVLDRHLAYVKDRYVDKGLLEFGTSNELILAWLDYYTPTLLAIRGPEKRHTEPGVFEYPIRLLGHDIPIGGRHQHQVTVKYPLYMSSSAVWAGIYRDDELIARFDELPTSYHDLTFTVDEPGDYRLLVIELYDPE